jgi:hypothetical protein
VLKLLVGGRLRQVVGEGYGAGEAGLMAGNSVGDPRAAQQDELGGEVSDAGQLLELGDGILGGQGEQPGGVEAAVKRGGGD